MRPLRIEIEGFASFRAPTIVDLADCDLVAFVGPTGAGKSTVIDAMTFALYGRVARYDDARLVHPAIHQAANEARVRLDFDVAGQRYTAVRIVRRTKSGATTREARLERLESAPTLFDAGPADHGPDAGADGPDSPVMASGAKEVSEAVESLLGLDFGQFTKTVVLPQGAFAEFLKDDPANRQRLLRRLLDLEVYSIMGSRARDEAKAASQRVDLLDEQLAKAADITPDRLAGAKERLAGLEAFSGLVAATVTKLAEVDERLAVMRREVTELDGAVERLEALELGFDADEEGSSDGLEAARTARDTARAELVECRARRDAARETAASAGDPARLEDVLGRAIRLLELDQELVELNDQHRQAGDALQTSERSVRETRNQLVAAQQRQAAARRSADAAAWTAQLHVGDPCPVCEQIVQSIPEHDRSGELAAADDAVLVAERTAAEAASNGAGAAALVERLGIRLAERQQQRETAAGVVGDRTPNEIEAELARATEAAEQRQVLEAAALELEERVDVASQRVAAAEEAERAKRTAFGRQRDTVADLDPPEPAGERVLDDWIALVAWSETKRADMADRRRRVAVEGKEAAVAKGALVNELETGAAPFGLAAGAAELPMAVARAQAEATADVATISQRLEQIDDWKAEREAAREQALVADELGRHLSASGFERWLLTEALDDLVARATDRLIELSGGQYSLAVDDTTFTVVDHRNADDQRDVRTLSGGETFLASLALALALSDSISELAPVGSPRLGSMFLDEGFGTLDPETLDVVASAIEELSATGRLVGIVTHIDALAERMPVRYAVAKGPLTSTIERVTA